MLSTLTQWLAGEFENRTQSLENPAWFVHLRLWHRLIPHAIDGQTALFAEQANALYLDQPYRQRILLIQPTANPEVLHGRYLAFKQPGDFRGAGQNPDRLSRVTIDDLEALPGCGLSILYKDSASWGQSPRFVAESPRDAKCYFQYDGQTRQVVLGFEVGEGVFRSYDRGVDPETGQSLWGAIMGPYEFQKC